MLSVLAGIWIIKKGAVYIVDTGSVVGSFGFGFLIADN